MKDNKVSHKFHIPVLGTGPSLDTAIKVSQFGIDSVISLTDENIIETTREFYSNKYGWDYELIKFKEENSRAKRITAYLNLVDKIVDIKLNKLKGMSFFEGYNNLHKNFQMLAPTHPVKEMITISPA